MPAHPAGGRRMEPAVLIFLLYVMIAHELVCGWMDYRKQAAKPRTHSRQMWGSSPRCRQRVPRVTCQPLRSERVADWKKRSRIVRKA